MSEPRETAATRRLRRAQRIQSPVGLLVLVVVLSVAAFLLAGATPTLHEFVISTLINAVIVVGLYIFIGNSGVVSFGHISFMALGAYITGLLTVLPGQKDFLLPDLPKFVADLHLATLPAMVLTVVIVMAIAAVIGLGIVRLMGIAASIATLSLLLVVNVVIVQTTSWTGGNQAFIGVPLTTTTPVAVACLVVAVAIAFAFERSSTGLRLRATREDEPAARAAGIGVGRERLAAFVLSAGVVGLAGAMYAHFLGSFDPPSFYLEVTFLTLAMLVVGGLYSLMGALIGTVVLSVVEEILGRLENGEGIGAIHLTLPDGTTNVILALVVIAVMLFRPSGLMGAWSGPRKPGAGSVSDAGAGDVDATVDDLEGAGRPDLTRPAQPATDSHSA